MHRRGLRPQSPSMTDLGSTRKGVAIRKKWQGPRTPPRESEWMGAAASRARPRCPAARPAVPTCQWRLLSALDDGHGFRGGGLEIQAGAAPPLDAQSRRWGELWGASQVRSWHHRNLRKKPHPSAWTPHKRPPHLPEAGRRGGPCGKGLLQHSGNHWKP